MKPTVSVVIPCFNAEAFIRETLESVLAQTVRPLELIVVDDGSADKSREIVSSFGDLVSLHCQSNKGVSSARNRGIEVAKGDWIAFVDADDLWLPNKLEKQLNLLVDNSAGAYTEVETFGTNSSVTRLAELTWKERHCPKNLAIDNCYPTPSALLVRRSVSPRFREWKGMFGEDLLYMLELVTLGTIELVHEPLTRYRKHSGGHAYSIVSMLRTHSTLLRWLDECDSLSASDSEEVRMAWLDQMVSLAWGMKERREWSNYWKFRHHLESFKGNKRIDELLGNRIFPRFVYWLIDFVKR